MIILTIDNTQRQEWIFRVGCWLLIVGVHLWLLFFIHNNKLISLDDSVAGSRYLSLSFSTSVDKNKPKVNDKQKLIKKAVKNSKGNLKSIAKKIELKALVNDQAKEIVAKNDRLVNNIIAGDTTSVDIMTEHHPIKKNIEKSIDNYEEFPDSATQSIVYNPTLAAPPVPPAYPEVARRKKQEGTVWLDVFLDEEGNQLQLDVHKSSGISVLDRAAISAVRQWKFSQYQKSYIDQLVTIRIPIQFTLN